MLLWGAVAVLGLTLIGLSSIIILDVADKGWSEWLTTVHGWQSTIGTVAGFLSAAGALVLSTAIADNAEQSRTARTENSIGQALAYEAERMLFPLQREYQIAQGIDRSGDGAADECKLLTAEIKANLITETPVYAAMLGHSLEFGEFNLSIFSRFYGYYEDFRQELDQALPQQCEQAPADRIVFLMRIMYGGFQYFALIANRYDVSPLQESSTVPPPDAP